MKYLHLPKRTFLLITALCAATFNGFAKENITPKAFGDSSPLFIENKGQIADQHGNKRTDIDYTISGNGVKLFISSGKIQYQWEKFENEPKPGEKFNKNIFATYYVMNVRLAGANTSAKVHTEYQQEYFEQYYTSGKTGQRANSYKKITYKNIYKNIDWVLYTTNANNSIKYDFVVHPGGNPNDIRINYEGATSLKIENGAVIATTPMGTITEEAPVSFCGEDKKNIPTKYKLNNNTLSFETEAYNGKLTIDPKLQWGTYYGSPDFTFGLNVTADTFGNVFLCGTTKSITAIASTVGVFQTTYAGGLYDGYFVKFNPDGTRAWATYFGDAGAEHVNAAACDRFGNIIITGTTSSGGNLGTSGSHQPLNGSQVVGSGYDYDAFVAKFASNAQIVWGTYLGGLYYDEGLSIATDKFDNIFVGGYTTSTNGLATIGAFLTTPKSGFLTKFNSAGVRQWGTYIRGLVNGVTTDADGDVYIAGTTFDTVTTSGGIATSGAHQSVYGGDGDAYFTKFNTSGVKLYGTFYGGYNGDEAHSIAVDSNKNIYLGGKTLSPNNIGTSNGNQPTFTGAAPQVIPDAFIVKFNHQGIRQWGTYIGDSIGADNIYALSMGPEGSVYVFGGAGSRTNIATPGAHQTTNAGPPPSPMPVPMQYTESDGFILRYTAGGTKRWGTYYGGSNWEYHTRGIVSRNKIYISGSTLSTTGIALAPAHQTTITGTSDPRAYLAQFEADTNVIIPSPFVDTNLCAGDSLYLRYITTQDFKATITGVSLNTFIVQLSDSAGSFASPVTIGSNNMFYSGIVPCKIPLTTYEARKYRIRIIASNPKDTFYHEGPNIRIWRYHKPMAGIFGTRDTVCENTAIILDDFNSSTWPYNYTWTGPNGFTGLFHNATVPAASVNISYMGNYIVTADNNGCKASDTIFVTVGMSPSAPRITGDTSICLGDTINLTGVCDTPNVSYVWQDPTLMGVGLTSQLIIPDVTFTNAGEYRLTAISALGCPSPTVKRVINIRPLPNPVISNLPPICSGDTLKLNVDDTAALTTYSWNGPGGFSSNAKSPYINNSTTANSGQYTVVNTNKYGCVASDTVDALVKPLPNQVDGSSNSPICSNSDLMLTAGNPTTSATYKWTGPAGYSNNSQNPTISGASTNASGIYKIVVDLNGCTKEDTTLVVVNENPDKPIISGNTPLYIGEILNLKIDNPQSGVSYFWLGPNNFSSPNLTPSVNSVLKAMGGIYVVTASIGNCTSSDSILVEILEKPEQVGKILFAYPNPNKGIFTIVASVSSDKDVEIGIFDTGGKLVHTEIATPKNKKLEHTVNTWGKLASGVYRVNVLIDGKVETISLTVQL